MVIPAAVSAAARTEPGLQTVWHLFSAVPGRMRITLPPAVARCRQIATFPPQDHRIDGLDFVLRSMASAFCCATTFGIDRMKTVC